MKALLVFWFCLTAPFIQKNDLPNLRDGHCFSAHGHVSVLFKINGYKVEWYKDGLVKEWAKGKIQKNIGDSILIVSFVKMRSSIHDEHFELQIHKVDNTFELSDYRYHAKDEMVLDLIRRVKKGATAKVAQGQGQRFILWNIT